VRSHGVADVARLGALRLADGVHDDMWRRQGASLFGEPATEGLHELVVHFLAAELGEQAPHLGDVLVVTPSLIGALLEHRGAAWRPTRPTHWRPAQSWCTHARSHRSRPHRPGRAWPAHPTSAIANCSAWRAGREVWLHFAPAAASARAGASAGSTAFATELVAAVFTSRRTPAVTVELTIGVKVVSF